MKKIRKLSFRTKPVLCFLSSTMAFVLPNFASAKDDQAVLIQSLCNTMHMKINGGEIDQGLQFIFPRLVELVGGPEKMASYLKQGASSVRQLGATMTCGLPDQFSRAGRYEFALVPIITEARIDDKLHGKGMFRQRTSSLAISDDNGKSWKFLIIKSKTIPTELIPDGIGRIEVPESDSGTFISD